jgi:two-component system nitrogen regulation response regulator GlnG
VRTDVRIIAATNQDLEALVAQGRFRADLYYRLKVATIRVPPLRDRRDDIPELAHYFLFRNSQEWGMDLRGFSDAALTCLQQYSWPGNVRELQSVIKEAMVRTRGSLVLPEYLPDYLRKGETATAAESENGALDLSRLLAALRQANESDIYSKVIGVVDRFLLQEILRQTNGNQARASDILGIDRKTLRQKMRRFGLVPDADEDAARNGQPAAYESKS